MTDRAYLALSLSACALLCAAEARADVAPPVDYVEQCSVEKRTNPTTECVECGETHNPEATGRCLKLLSGYGYQSACSPWGAGRYNHVEVWCRTKDPKAAALPVSISNQLLCYTAPVIEPNAASTSAPDCSSSKPIAASGGASSTSSSPAATTEPTVRDGAATDASDAASNSNVTDTSTAATNDKVANDTGCSVARDVGARSLSLVGLLGLVGLSLFAQRRRTR